MKKLKDFFPFKNIEKEFLLPLYGDKKDFLMKLSKRIWNDRFKTFDGRVYRDDFELTTPQRLFNRMNPPETEIIGKVISMEGESAIKLKIRLSSSSLMGTRFGFFVFTAIPIIIFVVALCGKIHWLPAIPAVLLPAAFDVIILILFKHNAETEIIRMAKLIESIADPKNN